MNISRFKALLGATALTIVAASATQAGGFDRGGVNIDQLFDAAPYSFEAGVTYVSPQRTLKNVRRLDPTGLTASAVKVDGDYAVPRVGLKFNVVEPVDCLASYTKPYGADADYGLNNAYSPTAVKFSIDTNDFGLTCSYKMDVSKGSVRFIGGLSYQDVDAFLSRQTLLGLTLPGVPLVGLGNTGVGTFKLSDSSWGWRIGTAYEMPEIAFRASLMYYSKYNYDGLSGTVDTTGFRGGPLADMRPGSTGVFPVTASAEIPQAVEFKFQSGIAPDWLAFGSVRWQEWSKLGVIPIKGVRNPIVGTPSNVSFDPLYRDGWTVAGGVGHKFNDMISAAAQITWDRGTSTISGYQSDTWNFGAGVSVAATQNIEFRLGGSIGIMTSGTSAFNGVGDTANLITYEFDNDPVYAGAASVKIKF